MPASVRGPQLSRWTSKACGPFYTSPGLALLTGWLDVIPPLPSFCTLTLSQLNSWSKTTYYRYLERDTHKNQTRRRRRRRTCESTIVSSQIWFLLQTGKVALIKRQQLKQASWLGEFVRLQTRLQAAAAARAPTHSTQQSPNHQILNKTPANFDSFICREFISYVSRINCEVSCSSLLLFHPLVVLLTSILQMLYIKQILFLSSY